MTAQMITNGYYCSARDEVQASYDGAGPLGAEAKQVAFDKYFMIGKEGVGLVKKILGPNCPKMGPIQENPNPKPKPHR